MIKHYNSRILIIILILSSLFFGLGLGAQALAWTAIESKHFKVFHNESEGSAREIQKIAEDFYPRITKELGYKMDKKINIWFCKSQREFRMAVNAPIQDWAAGCAYPQQARIVVRDPDSVKYKRLNLSRLVKHEIVHVIFGQYLGDNIRNVPRWFNEGVAMYGAGEWSYSQYWTMLTAALGHKLIPLYELSENFPEDEHGAHIAYAQSCSVVTFIAKKYGEKSLRQCISLLAEGRDMDLALAGSIGMDAVWLERKWQKKLKSYYKWITLISSWIFIWGLIVLILVAAYWRRRAKSRRIIQQWEEEEEDEQWWEFDDDEEIYE